MPDRHDRVLRIAKTMLEERRGDGPLTTEIIAEEVDRALALNAAWRSEVDRDSLIREIEVQFSVYTGRAAILTDRDEHRPWINARRIDWRFWGRYREALEAKWPPASVDELDRITSKTLDLLGNPEHLSGFDRRGLIAGEVQAGKTSNYTGLICKAADAGYKVIIVLAGLHDSLRSQTQLRLDEGFLGYDSKPIQGQEAGRRRPLGVGLLNQDPEIRADTITNRSPTGDFSRETADRFSIHAGGRPLLYVVKKNVKVLRNIETWIERTANRNDPATGRRHVAGVPLLMIDDEADIASIDTRQQDFDKAGNPDPDHDPTKINALIRRILLAFDMSSYVGYTATPFANVFIHDQGATTDEGADLFPRSFIINLRAPSDYFGPVSIFGSAEDGDATAAPMSNLVKHITDHAASLRPNETAGWMPPRHKKNHRPFHAGLPVPPPSLECAVRSFILACCARRLRSQQPAFNSMLIHVTRFQEVQNQVAVQVQEMLDQIKRGLRHGGEQSNAQAAAFYERWKDDFVPDGSSDAACEALWAPIEPLLVDVCPGIQVRTINGLTGDVLDYDVYRETGFDVIAVGGDKLARGLTLEGLTTSYFLRASKMYDTLMQMGRWFGYRDGYVDLCRLYMTSELEDWFEHITEAGEELRREFDHMSTVGGTPEEYGLKVKSHPTLLITSRVKMKHGTEMRVSFGGSISETTVFHRDATVVAQNFEATAALITRLGRPDTTGPVQQRAGGAHTWRGTHVWRDVPVEQILTFLAAYRTHPEADRANSRLLEKYIRAQLNHEELETWTVALISGPQGELIDIGGAAVRPLLRSPKTRIPAGTLASEGRFVIRRLLAPRDEAIDIESEAWSVALGQTIDEWRARTNEQRRGDVEPSAPSGPALRGQRSPTRGLLLLYPLKHSNEGEVFVDGQFPCVGFGISFPGSRHAETVSYRVNNIFWQQEYGGGE